MLFNSYIFVFIFFPLCLAGYYGLVRAGKPGAARVFLTGMSLWFYGYFNLSYLLIMVLSIGGNYLFHRLLSRMVSDGGEKAPGANGSATSARVVMALAVTVNLGVLFWFKYLDFFLGTLNGVLGTDFVLRGILLPLGISFFTFQQISFIVDTYRGETAFCSLSEYALFVSFFPQLIAGPIVNHSEMLPQFRAMGEKKPDWERIAGGFALFVAGLAKKVLLADTLGAGVDYGYENLAGLGRMDAVLVILFYALQLYFDFSGYCDMAVGIGRMLGIGIPFNLIPGAIAYYPESLLYKVRLYPPGRKPQGGGADVCQSADRLFFERPLARGGGSLYRLGDAARGALCGDKVLAKACAHKK